ncbi:hypothetical protein ZYGR_0P02600 [Zygosaccharomyces rouxii]|uniref:Type 2A phosphatase-associated protein 42 n=1 Tax=Zygosaccharomyces rouxii TaxID=4956 RepID=A0A1Q3A1L2_ZYGRO|nr:hypothetical protein ZYGR_0P02600 [Zygosaccharomyces rouxii]
MSLSQEYESLLRTYRDKIEHSSLRQDTTEYQSLVTKTIEKLLSLKNSIYGDLALFSSNETVDDISTKSLKLLSIDFYLALLFSRKQMVQLNDPLARQKMKLKFLEKTVQLFMQFLTTLQDYEILDPFLSKKIDSLEDTYNPSLQELYQQPAHGEDLSGAQKRRQQKIEMFRQSKTINEKLEFIESKYKSNEISSDDDEQMRKLYIKRLQSHSYQAFNEMEQILYELELLRNFTKSGGDPTAQQLEPPSERNSDSGKDSSGYTEKLELLNKPLLSKQGKVLRNFTLVDKRTQLQNKVRGYGQYGPTMSVEELLQKEFEENRVLQGGEEASNENVNEDDLNWQDQETYKARQWDEFKESVARGSGNTMNRG